MCKFLIECEEQKKKVSADMPTEERIGYRLSPPEERDSVSPLQKRPNDTGAS